MSSVPVTRLSVQLEADPRRVITKLYLPAELDPVTGLSRTDRVIQRVLALTPSDVTGTLEELKERFSERHADLHDIFLRNFGAVAQSVPPQATVSDEMKILIGAYFTHEYSLEGAALTNPSLVAAPDQSEAAAGALKVLVSLRAVGEGHISSVEFRSGLIGSDGEISLDAPGSPLTGTRETPTFDKAIFSAKLDEIGADADLIWKTLGRLTDRFSMADLDAALSDLHRNDASSEVVHNVIHVMHWLASSNYMLAFPPGSDVSQRVLFPSGPTESRGMEDARFVRFVGHEGEVAYYGTYTAFDGFRILPQLIVTTDFQNFRIATLNGPAAQNKGIALFPRHVAGRFVALTRLDGESNLLMMSDNVRSWHDAETIQIPTRSWELMQIGNAGSPIETEAGWLVITHSVGPMRQYALGAILLDIEDPRRVIGHLPSPLLEPDESERDGYVPNVVYSCGSLLHGDSLVLAYGAADTSTRFATLSLDSLLGELA